MDELLRNPVISIRLKNKMSIDELIHQMANSGSFGAGNLSKAVEIMEKMVLDPELKIFVGLSGALVPAGMKNIVTTMIENKFIDVLVSTGANLTHDTIEAFGGHHYKGTHKIDDSLLKKHNIDRIYDIFLPENDYLKYFDPHIYKLFKRFEKELKRSKIFKKIQKQPEVFPISSQDFFREFGKYMIEEHLGQDSIIRSAYENNVPIFCPAIQDSCFGLVAWQAFDENRFNQRNNSMIISAFNDVIEFVEIVRNCKKRGCLLVGGGVPKNFILQACYAITDVTYDYAVQLTMDRPEPGGLSGATLEEAVSWGKISEDAKKVQVISDATICLPILVAATLERINGNNKGVLEDGR